MLNVKPIINVRATVPVPQCVKCGRLEKLVVHHIIPRSEGGRNDPSNLELLCEECHRRLHQILPHQSDLRGLTDTFYDIQKLRIAIGNRISSMQEPSLSSIAYDLIELESGIEKELRAYLEPELIYHHYLSQIRGIGPILAANIIALIHDPRRFETVSALWHYCGYHVEDGHAPSLQKGKRITWNPKMRNLGYKIGKSFVICGAGYRKYYEQYKERYLASRPDLSRAHVDAMARRKTVKLFLAHLWHVWRTLEHLPTTSPNSRVKSVDVINPLVDTPEGPRDWTPTLQKLEVTPLP